MSLFQFHKGTIKTQVHLAAYSCYLYFNSIKVRLKLFTFLPLKAVAYHFNSIKVRLKPSALQDHKLPCSISIP